MNNVFRVGTDQTGLYLDIEPDLRHAPLIISESGCSTNTKAVSTPREKLEDKLVLDGRRSPILKRNDATRYSSACMRLSYLAQDRLVLAETAKHLAQRMSEPREFDFVPLKRAARYLVGRPTAALRFRRQKHVDKITVFVDCDFAGHPVSRKSTPGLVAQIGNHTVKSGLTLQSLTALSVGEAEFYAVVKGGHVGLSLRSIYQELGIPMKIEKQSDCSTANSLIGKQDSERNTLTHAVLLDTRTSSRRRRQYQEGAYSEELRRCWNEASVCLQFFNNIASLQDWYSTDHVSHTPLQDDGDEPMMDLVMGLQTLRHEHRNRQLSALIENIETDVQAE